ncbi:MAG: stage VI sporulation protein F [Bacilli bacterium]
MFKFSDEFFKKVEKKTNVNKDTILSLANKLQKANMKDEDTIRDLIHDISIMTGKNVSKEKEDKIVNAISKEDIAKNIDKMVE